MPVGETVSYCLVELPVLLKETMKRLSSLNVDGQAMSGFAADGGSTHHQAAAGKIGRDVHGLPGDGRPLGPGGGGPDQTPSASASNPLPPYPPDALARGTEGLVLLRVRIGVDGAIQAVKIHQSSGDASLDESALNTVRDRWQFAPAHQNGFSVPWEGLLPIRFRLHAD